MSKARVEWTQNALDAVRKQARWRRERGGDDGSQWIPDVFAKAQRLADHPWLGPPWRAANDQPVRQLVVGRYVLFYRVVEDGSLVQILTLRHHAQRPLEPDELK